MLKDVGTSPLQMPAMYIRCFIILEHQITSTILTVCIVGIFKTQIYAKKKCTTNWPQVCVLIIVNNMTLWSELGMLTVSNCK